MEEQQSQALCIWDGSVLEKAESEKVEGLCAVRSSKAKRLRKLKPGLFNQLSGPAARGEGDGMDRSGAGWTQARSHRCGHEVVESERSARDHPTASGTGGALSPTPRAWGERVLHVFDRGYASRNWLAVLQETEVRFLIRWQKGHVVWDAAGQERKMWQLIRGKRPQERREVYDARLHLPRLMGINVLSFRHPGYAAPLWLVVARPGGGKEPWYLVTNTPVTSLDEGWRMIFAYARRWQIELAFRYTKCELGIESPRLWKWDNRIKLLLMVTLAYVFLLSLLHPLLETMRIWLLRHWCHRTGKRCRRSHSTALSSSLGH